MKRKILALSLILSVVIGLSACNSDHGGDLIQTATGIESIKEVTSQTEKVTEVTTATEHQGKISTYKYTKDENGNIERISINLCKDNEIEYDYSELNGIINPKILYLSVDETSDFDIFEQYKQFSDSVEVMDLDILGYFDFSKLEMFENLTSVSMYIQGERTIDLNNINCLKNLENVSIGSNYDININDLSYCKNVKKISLSSWGPQFGQKIPTIYGFDKMEELPNFEEFSIDLVNIENDSDITKMKYLKILNLPYPTFTAEYLNQLPLLEELYCDHVVSSMIEGLSPPKLKKLVIYDRELVLDLKIISEIKTLKYQPVKEVS